MIIDVYIPVWTGQVTIVTKKEEFTRDVVRSSLTKYCETHTGGEKWIETHVEKVMRELREYYTDAEWNQAVSLTNPPIGFILIADFKPDGDGFNSLTHEILHFVFDLLKSKGIVHSNKSEEAYTYLMGYIVEQFLNQYNRK